MTIEDLADRYARERTALDTLKEAVKMQEANTDKAAGALFDAIEAAGLRAVKVEGMGTFSLYDMAWAKIVDREKALAWAEANMPEVITLNHQQLSVVVRDALKGEVTMPDGVDFSSSRKISWRKGQ